VAAVQDICAAIRSVAGDDPPAPSPATAHHDVAQAAE